jgi:hypothetical protein
MTNSFNGGELSPLLKGRTDIEKYYSGALTLENMLVRSQGAISKRPGTKYIAQSKSGEVILHPFVASQTESYVLEFGANYIRFYSNGSQITTTFGAWATTTQYVIGDLVTNSGSYYRCVVNHTSGAFATDLAAVYWVATTAADTAYEIVTPYAENELDEVRLVHCNDIAYIFHPNYAPRKLSRTGDTSWTLEVVDFSNYPFRELDDSGSTISATFYPEGVAAWSSGVNYEVGDVVSVVGDDVTGGNDLWYVTCIQDHTSAAATEDLTPNEGDFYNGDPAGGNWKGGDGYSTGDGNVYWYPYAYYDEDAVVYYADKYMQTGTPVSINQSIAGSLGTDMIGSQLKLYQNHTDQIFHDYDSDADAADTTHSGDWNGLYSWPFLVYGDWTFETYGTWYGDVKLQKSFDYGNNWYDVAEFTSASGAAQNFSRTGMESNDGIYYRIYYNCSVDNSQPEFIFKIDEPENEGVLEVTSMTPGGTTPDGNALASYSSCLIHYKLEDNASDSNVIDSTTTAETSTLYGSYTGTKTTASISDPNVYKVGTRSFHLDGANDHIKINSSIATALGSGSRTFSAWVRFDDFSAGHGIFNINNDSSYATWGVYCHTDGKLWLVYNNAAQSYGTTVLSADVWYLITATYNSSSSQHLVYINGVLEINKTGVPSYLDGTDQIIIGAWRDGTSSLTHSFDGYIDNLLIYNRVLTSAEIQAFYTTTETYYGVVKKPILDSFISPSGSTITSSSTNQWDECAWSPKFGFPRCGTFFQQRLIVASTETDRQTIWGSVTDDYENFKTGSDDDQAFAYTLASQQNNQILWVESEKKIAIGTSGGEFVMAATSLDEPLTPTNVQVVRQSTYGSYDVPGTLINSAVLFLQRNGKVVREFTYNFEKDGYVAEDMTILAEHITGGGITQMALQNVPNTILWAVREDGQLVGFTYERSHNITAWHRHVFTGTIESVCVIPGDNQDEVWLSELITINGTAMRQIIQMQDLDWGTTYSNAYFVDNGVTTSVTAAKTISSGLTHLEGKEVAVFADGTVLNDGYSSNANFVVTSGVITLSATNQTYTTVLVGLPYTAKLQTMPLEVQNNQIQAKNKRITAITARLYETGQLLIGTSWTIYNTIDLTGETLPYTGDDRVLFNMGYDKQAMIYMQSNDPVPLTLLAIMPEWEVY